MTAAIPQLTVPTQAVTATSTTTNGKPEISTPVAAKEEAPKKSIPEIETSNRIYFETSQKLKINSAIVFIEEVRNRKLGSTNSSGLVELYENPNGGSNAVVLHGLSNSDLSFICHKLSVGGFSVPRVDKQGRIVAAIHDDKVFKAYRERFPQTPVITNFFEQQEIRYEASLKAFQAKAAESTTDSISAEVPTV